MYLTIKDFSQMLQIKPSTLYAWVGQRKIPCVKIHGRIRFRSDDLEWWMRFNYEGTQVRKSTEVTEKKLATKIYHKVLTQLAEGK